MAPAAWSQGSEVEQQPRLGGGLLRYITRLSPPPTDYSIDYLLRCHRDYWG